MKARIMRKRYKTVLTLLANKIPAAFTSKSDKRKWISKVTSEWVKSRRRDR